MLLLLVNTCLLLAAAAWLWRLFCSSSSNSNLVPTVPGLPLLGSVVALGRGGTAFISQCRQRYGDVFCVKVLHQRMVFIFDPSMLSHFFKAPESEISFKPAVKQFTQRVYGLPSSEFFERHEPLLATLRQLLVPANLELMGRQLLQYAQPQLQQWIQQGQVELWSACKGLVFKSAGQVLFGEAFFARHGLDHVQRIFLEFEENFEVAASPLPHLLLPTFRRSRHQLLGMFGASLAAGDFEGTLVAQLLSGCGMNQQYWPNLLLAVLWASQANSMPALYWSIAFLLLPEQANARLQIVHELHAAVKAKQHSANPRQADAVNTSQAPPLQPQLQNLGQGSVDADITSAMIQLAMDRNSCVSRCVAEAIRLRLHSIAVRFVATNHLTLQANTAAPVTGCKGSTDAQCQQQRQEFHVQRGSILCICPMESHHDERLFAEDPWRFNPGRGAVRGLQPGTVVPSLAGMGFGGGFWRCPGRFFAELELAVMLQLVLLQLHIEPEPRQPHCLLKPQSGTAAKASVLCRSWEGVLPPELRDVLVFGAGALGGAQQQREQWGRSGDAQQLLPSANLLRLVGFKVPHGSWWVRVSDAHQAGH